MCHIIIYNIYVFNFYGSSIIADKFFNLYIFSFGQIIIPVFFLTGDFRYRMNVDNRGIFYALKKALLDPTYEHSM